MRGVGKGVHVTYRHRLYVFFVEKAAGTFDVGRLQRMDLFAFSTDPSCNGYPQISRDQWRNVSVAVVVLLFPNTASHLEGVAHDFGGQ